MHIGVSSTSSSVSRVSMFQSTAPGLSQNELWTSYGPWHLSVPNMNASCQQAFTSVHFGRRNYHKKAFWSAGMYKSTRASPIAAAMTVPTDVKTRSDWNQAGLILEELRESCDTSTPRLSLLVDAMVEEMNAGLAREGGSKDFKMILTYVDKLPSGDEKGHFYALDLGGTNFRVLRVCFGGKESPLKDQEYQEVSIPQDLMHGTHEELFDFIAEKLADFVSREDSSFHPLPGQKRELGFTFSFPVKQTSIDSGTLINWTKGFAVKGTAGKDVVQALNEAMERRGLDMIVTALVNDTVGTLAVASMGGSEGRQHDEEVMISVILGTGTNACYVEHIDAIPKWQGPRPKSEQMIISMEWGGFSSSHLPRTQYDDALDAESVNPGEQIFEKLLSGMYLGDLVRRILLRLAEETCIFGPEVPPKLHTRFLFGTPHVSAMHHDESPDLQEVGKVLSQVLGIEDCSLNVRKLVLEVCSIVTRRAGRLAGTGIVGILKKIGRHGAPTNCNTLPMKTVVAMDGGLYEHYPLFRHYLKTTVVELLGDNVAANVVIELSKDGSGIGAALLAAANSRCHPTKH